MKITGRKLVGWMIAASAGGVIGYLCPPMVSYEQVARFIAGLVAQNEFRTYYFPHIAAQSILTMLIFVIGNYAWAYFHGKAYKRALKESFMEAMLLGIFLTNLWISFS